MNEDELIDLDNDINIKNDILNYKGYFVEFVLTASPEASTKSLTQEQMKTAVDFLTDLDFVPAK